MKRYLALLMSAALVGIDQWLKLLAKEFLKPGETTPLIRDVLHLTYLENRGAAFGMMQNKKWLLVWATAAVLLILTLAVMAGKIKGTFPLFSVCTIIGGGIGNLIDRVYRGYVIDYIHVKIVNFAIFNFADICVTVGTAMLIFYLLFHELLGRKKTEEKAGA